MRVNSNLTRTVNPSTTGLPSSVERGIGSGSAFSMIDQGLARITGGRSRWPNDMGAMEPTTRNLFVFIGLCMAFYLGVMAIEKWDGK